MEGGPHCLWHVVISLSEESGGLPSLDALLLGCCLSLTLTQKLMYLPLATSVLTAVPCSTI